MQNRDIFASAVRTPIPTLTYITVQYLIKTNYIRCMTYLLTFIFSFRKCLSFCEFRVTPQMLINSRENNILTKSKWEIKSNTFNKKARALNCGSESCLSLSGFVFDKVSCIVCVCVFVRCRSSWSWLVWIKRHFLTPLADLSLPRWLHRRRSILKSCPKCCTSPC